MEHNTKRFTLDLESSLQRRLKVVAALKGISMRRYCQTAIEKELAKDQTEGTMSLPFGEDAINRLVSLQAEIFHGNRLSGDSTDLVRESREARAKSI